MTGFTVFIDGFESFARDSGLSLNRAFSLIVELAGYSHHFSGGTLTLTTTSKDGLVEIVLQSDASIETDARRELMLKAIDGRLRGFKALPDTDFIGVKRIGSSP